jgi:general secretion pathway protein D
MRLGTGAMPALDQADPAVNRRLQAVRWVGAFVGLVFLAGCAEQRIRETAQSQLRAGNYEGALQSLRSGLTDYPESNLLRAGLVETQSDAATRIVNLALAARNEGRLDDAERLLQRALAMAPDDARAPSLLSSLASDRRQRAALSEAEALVAKRQPVAALKVANEALKANPKQPELLALKRQLEAEQRQADLKASQLGLAETRPISLDFRDASLRTVLDAVSRNSGLNVILDKDIKAETRVTVYLRSAKVEDAIDLITSTNQLAKKVVDSKTLLIYPNTPDKQKEHQEQIVRVFYLASADVKGAGAFLKSMLKIREPYVDERSNMLALRDSQENIQLAERLIALYDSAEPEVLLELDVIEINTTRLTELGVQFPSTFSLNVLPPAAQAGLNLANIRGLTRDRIGLSIGGVTVNLRRETGDFNTLANPRIRVKNREKAHVLVGDKVPIVTTTQGSTGFVSESINYIDVGLKLDVEPVVYVDDDVGIKVSLEVSTLGTQIKTATGSIAYQIGTRNASTLLRLHDGETQLLAGLISAEDRRSATKVPGLGELPLAGRLFSSQLDNGQRVELVLSITPHVIRNQRRPDASEAELWVGTDALPRLRPTGGVIAAIEVAKSEAAASGGLAPPGALSAAMPPAAVSPPSASENLAIAAPAGPALRLSGPSQVKVGDTFVVTLDLQTQQPLRGVPLQFTYPKERLQLLDIQEGELFKQGGAQTSFTKTIDGAVGQASAGMLRATATGAIGQGTAVTLQFKAAAAGLAEVALTGANPVGLSGPVPPIASLPMLRVQVQ